MVWVVPAPETLDAATATQLGAVLSTDERARVDRYRDADARARHLVGRAALRVLVAHHLDIRPDAVVLTRADRGGPRVTGPGAPHVSVAHTSGLVLVALDPHRRIGIDVERRDRVVPPAVRARSCTPAELAWLAGQAPGAEAAAFLRLWVRKEAVAKADGRGLGVGVGRVEVLGTTAGRAASDAAGAGQEHVPIAVQVPGRTPQERASRWWVTDLGAGAGPLLGAGADHLGAIAVEAADAPSDEAHHADVDPDRVRAATQPRIDTVGFRDLVAG